MDIKNVHYIFQLTHINKTVLNIYWLTQNTRGNNKITVTPIIANHL